MGNTFSHLRYCPRPYQPAAASGKLLPMGSNGKRETFSERRQRLIGKIGPDAIVVLPSAPVSVRSNDVEFIYRQDSDFYYLTGFAEPESVAVIAPGHRDGEFVLFVRPRDKERETWTGRRAGVEGAVIDYGADKAYPVAELERVLGEYLHGYQRVLFPIGINQEMTDRMLAMLRASYQRRPQSGDGPG